MSEVVAVFTVCPSISEGRRGVVGKNSGSSCRRIPFPKAVALSGATGLPLFESDQSVGVPCRCSLEVSEVVRCGVM